MKKFLLILILTMLFACNNDSEEEFLIGDIFDVSITLYVKDTEGNNLLAPETLGTYNTGSIVISYLIDGEIIPAATYFGSQDYILDNPYAYGIVESEDGAGEYYMGILPNHISSTDGIYRTYLKWNDSDTDTIDCEIEGTGMNMTCTKVIYNGETVWDSSSKTAREIEIIK